MRSLKEAAMRGAMIGLIAGSASGGIRLNSEPQSPVTANVNTPIETPAFPEGVDTEDLTLFRDLVKENFNLEYCTSLKAAVNPDFPLYYFLKVKSFETRDNDSRQDPLKKIVSFSVNSPSDLKSDSVISMEIYYGLEQKADRIVLRYSLPEILGLKPNGKTYSQEQLKEMAARVLVLNKYRWIDNEYPVKKNGITEKRKFGIKTTIRGAKPPLIEHFVDPQGKGSITLTYRGSKKI